MCCSGKMLYERTPQIYECRLSLSYIIVDNSFAFPFYPLYTGRRDSLIAFSDVATFELPSPQADLSETLAAFSSRVFDLRETVSLLGKTFVVYFFFFLVSKSMY